MTKSCRKHMEKAAMRPKGCPSRRHFLKACATLAAGAAVGGPALLGPGPALAAPVLPAWRGTAAVSDVYVVRDVPTPACSLADGVLPDAGRCANPATAFCDPGVETLVRLMEAGGTPFYRTVARPGGIVPGDAVVILKVNNQWGGGGGGSGLGRMATNTDLLKGMIWRILNHPDGFSGEVVVADNAQPISANRWDAIPANAEDRNQTFASVVAAFASRGYPVTLADWTALNANLVDGGVPGPGHANGEYATGDMDDAYIVFGETDEPTARRLSYPKFQTPGGRYVSLRHGLWNGTEYEADRVCLINFPVLKKHCMAGCTAAWKNLVGFVSCQNPEGRFGGWDEMHGYFWDYVPVAPSGYGLLGRVMALVRAPDLHVLDAVWVCTDNNFDSRQAMRADVVMASRDSFALDWYASEYLLRPLVPDSPQDSSAARGGIFRSATRINQKAAKAVGGGGSSGMDLLAGYDGDAPHEAERNQLNVLVATAAAAAVVPGVSLLLDQEA